MTSSPVNSDASSTRNRKRKMKKRIPNRAENLHSNSVVRWKSEAQRNIYSSKLVHALGQLRLRLGSGTSGAEISSPRRVREAADGVLAATAKGRSRWSRAILKNRLRLRFTKKNSFSKRQRKVITAITTGGNGRLQKKSKVSVGRLQSKCLPAFQRKARLLSRLVPGCRKLPLPVVLEEATDYIPALEMQVRAMGALAELLSVSVSSSNGSAVATTSGVNHQLSSSRTRL